MNATDEQPEDRWAHVPPEAKSIAMERNGDWYWYVNKPNISIKDRLWQSGTRYGLIYPQPKPHHPWTDSLEERP